MYVKSQKSTCLKWTYRILSHNYRVTILSSFYLTASGISIPSLKSKGQL